jgi:hypothetical protein
MRPPRRFTLSHCGYIFSLLAVFSGASLAQSSNPSSQPVHSAQVATSEQVQFPAKWSDAVHTLAARIAAAASPSRSLSIEWKNLSTLNAAEIAFIQKILIDELKRRHFQVAQKTAGPNTSVRVELSLSESITGYVWVAKVHGGVSEETAIVAVSKSASEAGGGTKTSLSVQRKLIWAQSERFLDFVLPDITPNGVPHMVVLEPSRVSYYDFKQAHWEQRQIIRLHPLASASRDPRGMVFLWGGSLEIYVAGESCTGSAAISLELNCSSDLPVPPEIEWPLNAGGEERGSATFEKARNYFGGLMAIYGDLEAKLPPFFTAAVMNSENDTHWVLAELDGKARLYDDSAKAKTTFTGWGDDIASVVTGCDGFWQVLATGSGDWTRPDQIQVYELTGGQPIAVGSRLEFPGPILALWPSTDQRSARVVSRNLQTGMYEASIVSVSCSN